MSKKNSSTKKTNKNIAGIILFVVVVLLVLVAIIVAIVTFFIGHGNQNSEIDLGSFITIFAILITAISIIPPIASYIINKDDFKKLAEDFKSKTDQVDEKIGYLDKKINSLDVRHIELLENLIKRNNMAKIVTNDPYVIVGIEYINALLLFEKGAYEESELRVENAIEAIFEKQLYNIGIDEERYTLLIYKVFNLYRKIAGRTRSFETGLLHSLELLISKLKQDNSLLYKTIVFLYVKSVLDKVEKTFDISDKDSIEDLDKLIETVKYDKVVYYTLKSQEQYILAYFYRIGKIKDHYKQAIEFAEKAYKKQQEQAGISLNSEVEKLLISDCMFIMAKVIEKSSYSVENGKEKINTSKDIIEQLLKGKTDAKYYLELSEILKKSDKIEESNEAAQYGYLLAPTDPLLAAQCAYVYLREYLKDKTNPFNLNKAQEFIKTAHWVYIREKERYKNNINAKFSYIASLNAIITTYKYIDEKTDISDELINNIRSDINNSIADNGYNVPNYQRALIVYLEIFKYSKNKEIKAICCKEARNHIKEFQENSAFSFAEGEKFYEFSSKLTVIPIRKISDDKLIEKLKTLLDPIIDKV